LVWRTGGSADVTTLVSYQILREGDQTSPDPPGFSFPAGPAFEMRNGRYHFKLTVRNDGPGAAHVSATCNWTCQGGVVISGWSQVVKGGYLAAEQTQSYSALANGMCIGPPALINATCEVEMRGYGSDNKPSNQSRKRTWTGSVVVPQQ
jgi:hypothetical protein